MNLNAARSQCAAQTNISDRSWQPLEILALTILGIASLGLIRYTDLFLYRAATHLPPAAAWIPDVRITSCLIAFALYVLVHKRWPTHRKTLQMKDASWVALVSTGWLLGTVVAVSWVRVYLPPIHGVVETLAFLVFGLMAEEFLFRGAMFSVATERGLVCYLRFRNLFQPLAFSVPRLPPDPGSHNSGGIHISHGHYVRFPERAIRSSLARHSGPFHKQRNRSAAILAIVPE